MAIQSSLVRITIFAEFMAITLLSIFGVGRLPAPINIVLDFILIAFVVQTIVKAWEGRAGYGAWI